MTRKSFLKLAFLMSIFILGTDNLIVAPLLAQIAKTISATSQFASLGIAAYSGAYGVFAVVLAPISDIYGRKMVIGISGLSFGVFSILLGLCATGWWFLLLRFLTGLSAAVLGPSLWAYCAENFDAHEREMMISWMMSFFSLATVLGVPIGLLISQFFNWQIIFLITGFLMIAMVIIFYQFGVKTKRINFSLKRHFNNIGKALMVNGQLNAGMLLSSGSYMVVYSFLSVWIQKISHINSGQLAWLFLLIGVMSFIGSMMSGQLLKRSTASRLVSFSWFLQILLIVLTILVFKQPMLLAVTFSVWALLVNFGNSAFVNMISETAPAIRGSIMALNNSSIFLGFTLGSTLGGLAMQLNHTLLINLLIAGGFSLIAFGLLKVKGHSRKAVN